MYDATASAFQVRTDELRVGTATPYARLVNLPANGGGWFINLQPDGITRDDATKAGVQCNFDCPSNSFNYKRVTAAGAVVNGAPDLNFWIDHGLHTVTGLTGNQVVASKVLPGNSLGPHGRIFLHVDATVTTGASGGMGIQVLYGGAGITVATLGPNSGGFLWIDVRIDNKGSTGAQLVEGIMVVAGSTFAGSNNALTVDSTANQTLSINVVPTLTTDSFSTSTIEGAILPYPTVM
jgi:hypothetical protein